MQRNGSELSLCGTVFSSLFGFNLITYLWVALANNPSSVFKITAADVGRTKFKRVETKITRKATRKTGNLTKETNSEKNFQVFPMTLMRSSQVKIGTVINKGR